ncbi:BBE domain-containing protein [Paenibacillus sp. P26]|nr:BBE domain-containing protein [Paenibacillus sp. P26]
MGRKRRTFIGRSGSELRCSPFTRGAYRDYADRLISDWPAAYYGENLNKLKEVKRRYDPENFFHFEQSIPLA